MPRMPKKRKLELSFFLNERGRVTYNDLCRKCQRTCKQSFRAVIVYYGKNVPLFRRNGYRKPGAMIP